MKKAVIFGLLILVTGFVLWRVIVAEFFNPADELAMRLEKETFAWFTCPSCGDLFMAEATTRKGYCPYCESQMMLVTEVRTLLGKSVNKDEFIYFFSPKCGNLFFAYETHEMGRCPYCAEELDLTAPVTTDLAQQGSYMTAWNESPSGWLLTGAVVLFVLSIAGIYILLERRTILSLVPTEGTVSKDMKIELSKWKARKKKLTLGNTPDSDILLKDPALKDIHCILSLVYVGGKAHAYLSRSENKPILINEQQKYNPRLRHRDKIKLGDIEFEVNTRGK